MLTIISGNNRDGYPCALNKVSGIFQCGIPPFETEGLPDVGEASQKEAFPLAGSLSLIFSSVNVASSDSAGVTVSMTSEDSAGYVKWELCSSLAKVRKCNLINWLKTDDSGFLQTVRKEKGPEVNPALLSTLIIFSRRNSQGLEHNSHLQATGFAEWQPPSQPLGSMPRDCNLSRASCFNQFARLTPSRSASDSICSFRDGDIRILNCGDWPPPLGFLSLVVDKWPPIQLVSSLIGGHFKQVRPIIITPPSGADYTKRGLTKPLIGVTVMAEHQHTQTRPKFTDTYWIIPEYETTPYGKVSFTRQDRRTFIAMFKDSRLIWAGRKPVQGMVKITPPSTITNIVTVQGVAHV